MTEDARSHDDPLAEGLFEFFASQAEVMLAQYKNINQLLGPTTDWTHPGTHCEVLLRDFLRRSLPSRFGVDKGYIFGRSVRDGRDVHCPEIDILIHDTQEYRPIYRLEDFVIVQPEAVKGIIQVKRALRMGEDGSFNRGLQNVVTAKQHVVDTLRQSAKRQDPDMGFFSPTRPLFAGLIGVEDHLTESDPPYHDQLRSWRTKHQAYWQKMEQDTSIYVLPQFVGSLMGQFVVGPDVTHLERKWFVFKSVHEGKNVALQYFLWMLSHVLWRKDIAPDVDRFPLFAFPSEMKPVDEFSISYRDDDSAHSDQRP